MTDWADDAAHEFFNRIKFTADTTDDERRYAAALRKAKADGMRAVLQLDTDAWFMPDYDREGDYAGDAFIEGYFKDAINAAAQAIEDGK